MDRLYGLNGSISFIDPKNKRQCSKKHEFVHCFSSFSAYHQFFDLLAFKDGIVFFSCATVSDVWASPLDNTTPAFLRRM
jgi:hypothetical protein